MKFLKTVKTGVAVLTGLVIFSGFSFGIFCQKAYNPKYFAKKGEKFTVNYFRKNLNAREVMGNEMVNLQEDSYKYEFTVKSNSGDGMDLEMKYIEKADKTDDPQFPVGTDYSALEGKTVEFFLSSTGKVSKFENFDELPEIEVRIRDTKFFEDTYKNELKQLFYALPGKSIDIGETWSDKIEFNEHLAGGGVKIIINSDYKLLEEIQKDGIKCLKIDVKFTMEITGGGTLNAMDFDFNMKGSGNETVYFSQEKGMFVSVEGKSTMQGSADFKEVEMSVPIKQDIETRINVTFQ